MTGVFKSNNPSNVFILLIYGLVLKFGFMPASTTPVMQVMDGYLYKSFISGLGHLFGNSSMMYPVLAFLCLFVQAVAVCRIFNHFRLFPKQHYLTGMFLLLLSSLSPAFNQLSSPLLASTIVLFIFAQLVGLYNTSKPKTILFNISLLTGLCFLIYYPTVFFLILLLVGMVLFRPFHIRELIVIITGLIAPAYFFFSLAWLLDKLHLTAPRVGLSLPQLNFDFGQWIAFALVTLSVLLGSYFMQANLRKQLLQARKAWLLLYWYLGVAMVCPLFNTVPHLSQWAFTFFPLAAIGGCFFYYSEKKFLNLSIHWLLFAACLLISYGFSNFKV